MDEQQRRAEGLQRGAERILNSIRKRALAASDGDALAAFFAGDPLVAKVRSIADELRTR